MRVRLTLGLVGLFLIAAATTSLAAPDSAATLIQQEDNEVPPGNPVIGSDRPGDIEQVDNTNYGLWGLVAVCLIGAGVVLVKVERWESRRRDAA